MPALSGLGGLRREAAQPWIADRPGEPFHNNCGKKRPEDWGGDRGFLTRGWRIGSRGGGWKWDS